MSNKNHPSASSAKTSPEKGAETPPEKGAETTAGTEGETSPDTEGEPEKVRQLFGKELAAFTPYMRWSTGMQVVGEVSRKFENTSAFGTKGNIEITLIKPIEFTDADGEVIQLNRGDKLNVGQTAGLSAAMTLDVGTKVQILCTGKKDLGRGRQPAWEFKVFYE